jgi:hypothetical protein
MKGSSVKGKPLISIVFSTLCAFTHSTAAHYDDTLVSESRGQFADIARMEEILTAALVESKTETLNTLFASDFVLYSDLEGLADAVRSSWESPIGRTIFGWLRSNAIPQ